MIAVGQANIQDLMWLDEEETNAFISRFQLVSKSFQTKFPAYYARPTSDAVADANRLCFTRTTIAHAKWNLYNVQIPASTVPMPRSNRHSELLGGRDDYVAQQNSADI
ncbi:hypothetical protein BGZ61DRAFT_480442 [Ilyonectria robusta]|uniref:uncharacterized protein n=1 Tax=Ilyonectria robusta TaxID=1079257 RepID=UPI001E8DDA35|nr:uncharacterized protein BGZ61DRAFT_480442 [Ilyonectria robusta]KAH8684179.1 hypothetical protein BGZ61DRAFT_480442 [Ilyonectria robusta]